MLPTSHSVLPLAVVSKRLSLVPRLARFSSSASSPARQSISIEIELPFGLVGCSIGLVAAILLVAWIPYGDYLAPWPVAYATVSLGLLNPGRAALVKDVDYSYGLFLYGYPIQQALAATSDWARLWPINFAATLMIASLVAMLSWHFVERPSVRTATQIERIGEPMARSCEEGEHASPQEGERRRYVTS